MRQAAKTLGISRDTLRRWLKDGGYETPKVPRGSKVWLSDDDIHLLLLKHSLRRTA
jgi:excisionase family DNA binding protein